MRGVPALRRLLPIISGVCLSCPLGVCLYGGHAS